MVINKNKEGARIGFIHGGLRSFVQRDLDFLSANYAVQPYHCSGGIKWIGDFFHILRITKKTDVIICWFAGIHAAIAALACQIYDRRLIIIVGGYDVTSQPEYDHGAFRTRREGLPAKYSLRRADLVLPVDESLLEEASKFLDLDKDKWRTLPTGYDANYFTPAAKNGTVLTVGSINSSTWKRKGIDSFIEAATRLSSTQFIVAGNISSSVRKKLTKIRIPTNVHFTGRLDDIQLLEKFQHASVYCQLSRFEGLPNALCEAMLCACVPVGTRANGIPRAIGKNGFIVNTIDPDEIAEAISEALEHPEIGHDARTHIKQNFSATQRHHGLRKAIASLTRF